jgi:hypothetical protein
VSAGRRKEKLRPFVPKLYRRAPRLVKDSFVRYIQEFETNRQKQDITLEEADRYFVILRQQSHEARQDKRKDDIWITHDVSTGEWGGYETPFKQYLAPATVAAKTGGVAKTNRSQFGGVTGRTKWEFIEEVMAIAGCDLEAAERKFNALKANGLARYCAVTLLWYGKDAEPPTIDDKAPTVTNHQASRVRAALRSNAGAYA